MESIYTLPIAVMLVLTFLVWLRLFVVRLNFMLRNNIDAEKVHSPEQLTSVLPNSANQPANNFKNLFEMPVVFYVLTICAALTNFQSPLFINLIWGFVAFRIVHSIIHCSYNRVMHRFISYLISSICLWVAVFIFIEGVL